MTKLSFVAILAGLTLAGVASAAEIDGPLEVTTFELKDGSKFHAVSYAAVGRDDLKSFIISTPENVKAIILEKEIVNRKKESIAFVDLSDTARKAVLHDRAVAADRKAEFEASEIDRKVVEAARRKENDIRMSIAHSNEDINVAHDTLANAEDLIRNTPIEVAKADARYDAAKTELAGGGGGGYPVVGGVRYANSVDSRRSDYLRKLMTDAAEEKARLELGKKDAQDIVTRTTENLKVLQNHVADLSKRLDAAQAETKAAVEHAEKTAKERQALREEKNRAAPKSDEVKK
jgi:hypothetical protein